MNTKQFDPANFHTYLLAHRMKGHTTIRVSLHGKGPRGKESAMKAFRQLFVRDWQTLKILRIESITGEIFEATPDMPAAQVVKTKRIGLFDEI